MAEGEYKEALEIFKGLCKDNPVVYRGDLATTFNNLGLLHEDLNLFLLAEWEYKEALKYRRLLAETNPTQYLGDVFKSLINLALLHKSLNRPDEAVAEFEEALDIMRRLAVGNPASYKGKAADIHNCLAYLYAYQKEFVKAIDAIDQAIALFPENADYYDSKGEILLMKGDEHAALMMWFKVIELDPDFLLKYNGETDFHRQLKEKGLIEE